MTGDDNATMPQYRREYAQRSAVLLDHDLNDQDLQRFGEQRSRPMSVAGTAFLGKHRIC